MVNNHPHHSHTSKNINFPKTTRFHRAIINYTSISPRNPNETLKRLTLREAKKLEKDSERIFGMAVCAIPHLVVYHDAFEVKNSKGITVPDFYVINTLRPDGKGKYVEVTLSENLNYPHKEKQKRVMDQEKKERGINHTQLSGIFIQKIKLLLGL